jgi:hypothetical protein
MSRTTVAVRLLSPGPSGFHPNPRRGGGIPIIAGSPRAPGLDPSPRRAEGLPVIAASPSAMASGGKPTAVPLPLGQPSPPSLSLLSWSMRPWQSTRVRCLRADGLPGSHGPSEERINEQDVELWLTSRRRAALRNLPARGHFVRPRRRSAGQSCRGSGQDGSLARGPGRDGSLGRNPGQQASAGGAAAGLCLEHALGAMRGARPWRPPAS